MYYSTFPPQMPGPGLQPMVPMFMPMPMEQPTPQYIQQQMAQPVPHSLKDSGRAFLPPRKRNRPYTLAASGSVPADVLQEYSVKLAEILNVNPPAAYMEFYNGDMAQVDQNTFLGSLRHAENGPELLRQGVTHVLNCAGSCCPNHHDSFYAPYKIEVVVLDAADAPDFPILHYHFDKAFDFLEHSSRKPNSHCLVHCYQGLNRSTTLLAAYMMIKHRMTLVSVVERLHAARPFILSNLGFRQQLIEFAYANELLLDGSLSGMSPSQVKPRTPRPLNRNGPESPRQLPISPPTQPYVAGPNGAMPRPLGPSQNEAPVAPGTPECGYNNLREVPSPTAQVQPKPRRKLDRMMSSLQNRFR